MKKIAITGPREPPSVTSDLVDRWLRSLDHTDVMLFHGNAKGVDRMVRDLGRSLGFRVTAVEPHYGGTIPGSAAPLVRNAEMVSRVDSVVGFWHGKPYGGTLNTLWASQKILGKKPTWFLTEKCDDLWAEHIFETTLKRPPLHWEEALRLWEQSKSRA